MFNEVRDSSRKGDCSFVKYSHYEGVGAWAADNSGYP